MDKNKNISKMSNFILNYCIKAKPKSILIKEVLVVCYSENEKVDFSPKTYADIVDNTEKSDPFMQEPSHLSESFKVPVCPF